MRQAMKQADKQRSESAPDLFLDGLEDDLVLGGAFLVVDAFAIYRWSPERRLWMPVRVQVMMVQPPRLGPGAGFLEVPASPRRSSSCWSLCLRDLPCVPRLRGGVGAVEDAPSDASSAVDLPPPSGTTNDDDSATYVLVLSITSIESLVGFREFWIVMCPWRVWHYE